MENKCPATECLKNFLGYCLCEDVKMDDERGVCFSYKVDEGVFSKPMRDDWRNVIGSVRVKAPFNSTIRRVI